MQLDNLPKSCSSMMPFSVTFDTVDIKLNLFNAVYFMSHQTNQITILLFKHLILALKLQKYDATLESQILGVRFYSILFCSGFFYIFFFFKNFLDFFFLHISIIQYQVKSGKLFRIYRKQ